VSVWVGEEIQALPRSPGVGGTCAFTDISPEPCQRVTVLVASHASTGGLERSRALDHAQSNHAQSNHARSSPQKRQVDRIFVCAAPILEHAPWPSTPGDRELMQGAGFASWDAGKDAHQVGLSADSDLAKDGT
jgi:hypothetical protein